MNSAALTHWSVGGGGDPSVDRVVIFAPYDSDLVEAFELAEQASNEAPGAPIRVVGRGATRRALWPSWVRQALDKVTLTEVDAYLPRDRAALCAPLVANGRRWVEQIFGGLLDGDLARALWATVANRTLLPAFSAWPLCSGIAHAHAAAEIWCVRHNWPGREALTQLVRPSGGRVRSPNEGGTRWRKPLGRAVLNSVTVSAAMAAAFATRMAELRHMRRQLAYLEHQRTPGTPDVWVGVVGNDVSTSRQSIAAAAQLRDAGITTVGVLLQANLGAEGKGFSDFPSVEKLKEHVDVACVEQVVSVRDARDLAALGQTYSAACRRVLERLREHGWQIDLGPLTVSLTDNPDGAVRLLSIDLLRAVEASIATRHVLSRHDFGRKTVLWPHASLVNMALPDVMMQKAGARTAEIVHGAFSDPVDVQTYAASTCTTRLSWSHAEAQSMQPFVFDQHCVGGVTLRPQRATEPRRAPDGEPCRVLLLTNYGHGLGSQTVDRPSLVVYLEAFFRAVGTALNALQSKGVRVKTRWRAHPHDEVKTTQRLFAEGRGFIDELSTPERLLREELAWANVVVTTWSSTVVEALDFPVSVFLHQIPILDPAGVVASFDESRLFEDPETLTRHLNACVESWGRGDSDCLEPEERLRKAFFGADARPLPFSNWLQQQREPTSSH